MLLVNQAATLPPPTHRPGLQHRASNKETPPPEYEQHIVICVLKAVTTNITNYVQQSVPLMMCPMSGLVSVQCNVS